MQPRLYVCIHVRYVSKYVWVPSVRRRRTGLTAPLHEAARTRCVCTYVSRCLHASTLPERRPRTVPTHIHRAHIYICTCLRSVRGLRCVRTAEHGSPHSAHTYTFRATPLSVNKPEPVCACTIYIHGEWGVHTHVYIFRMRLHKYSGLGFFSFFFSFFFFLFFFFNFVAICDATVRTNATAYIHTYFILTFHMYKYFPRVRSLRSELHPLPPVHSQHGNYVGRTTGETCELAGGGCGWVGGSSAAGGHTHTHMIHSYLHMYIHT